MHSKIVIDYVLLAGHCLISREFEFSIKFFFAQATVLTKMASMILLVIACDYDSSIVNVMRNILFLCQGRPLSLL